MPTKAQAKRERANRSRVSLDNLVEWSLTDEYTRTDLPGVPRVQGIVEDMDALEGLILVALKAPRSAANVNKYFYEFLSNVAIAVRAHMLDNVSDNIVDELPRMHDHNGATISAIVAHFNTPPLETTDPVVSEERARRSAKIRAWFDALKRTQ